MINYDEAVRLGKDAAKSQWTLGDLALDLEPKYGDKTLAIFADDIGIELKTLQDYRTVSAAYPEKSGRPDTFGIARTLAAQPDRSELESRKQVAAEPMSRVEQIIRLEAEYERARVEIGLLRQLERLGL